MSWIVNFAYSFNCEGQREQLLDFVRLAALAFLHESTDPRLRQMRRGLQADLKEAVK